jgi:hypothetical protein
VALWAALFEPGPGLPNRKQIKPNVSPGVLSTSYKRCGTFELRNARQRVISKLYPHLPRQVQGNVPESDQAHNYITHAARSPIETNVPVA